MGGDHTIALPLLRSLTKFHNLTTPVTLLHFDAHLDTWDTYFNEPYTHGTPFRRAAEENLFCQETSMHIGIRGSVYSQQDFIDDENLGFKIVRCHDIEKFGLATVIQKIHNRILGNGNPSSTENNNNNNTQKKNENKTKKYVYISIDIDVLDPGFAPGTGTPESGGLTYRELQSILWSLKHKSDNLIEIVGADIVEVSPSYDHAEITSIAAANLAYELMSLMALDFSPLKPPHKLAQKNKL